MRAGGERQAAHLTRMQASARYFGYRFDAAEAVKALDAVGAGLRVRLGLGPDGKFSIASGVLAPLTEPVKVFIAHDATRADGLFLRHKTSVRARYDAAWREAEARGGFDCLFFNERDELTEGGRCNVFVKVDGRWCTPPLSAGVLPGIMRAAMLADPAWDAQERTITRRMFTEATKIIVCNSLRGALTATL
jgi:para-aminobenzoate synthetase/4-amino-4-deoxychorismate lyase